MDCVLPLVSGVLVGVALLLRVAPALAAPPGEPEGPSSAAPDAQPGLERVGLAEPAAPTLAATGAYGLTEAQGAADGTHHRGSLRLAAAAAVLRWLNVAPSVHGRYDVHPSNGGFVLDAALAARAVLPLRDLRVGAELRGWVPGAENGSTMLRSASLDARALVGARAGRLVFAGAAGYRFDRSGNGGDNAARLGPGDRLALGLSDFDAVLLGLGAGARFGTVEVLAEGTAELLVGRGAPVASESPLRAAAGARLWLSRRVSASLGVEVSLSGRPELAATSALVPIDPRVTTSLGLRYAFLAPDPAPAAVTRAVPTPSQPPAVPPAPAVPPPPTEATLELSVSDDTGATVPNVSAWVRIGDEQRPLSPAEPGRFAELALPPGNVTLHIEAPGFEPLEKSMTLTAAPAKVALRLVALPPPSQVRGVVRSLSGKAVVAKIRVEPSGLEATTDATGAFQLDVPPGAYEVVIEAAGYRSQRRKVQVEAQGVVILNADLVKGP
jgi:hypothetical protein